jgi:hypothetical protein
MKYERPITYHSGDLAKVKVSADKQPQNSEKLHAPDLSIQGHKNSV